MFYQSEVGPIYYELDGPENAPAVAFTHGGGLTGAMFEAQVAALSPDYRTLTWDLQGHGRSTPLEANLDVPDMADCLIGIMDEAGIEQAVVVGQSLGTYVSQHAAIRHPERVLGIVSIGGLPIDEPMASLELFMFRALMAVSRLFPERVLFGRAANEKATTEAARAFFFESMSQMGKEQFLWMLGGQLDACTIEVADPPSQPLLITHGEHEMPKSLIKGNQAWHAATPGSRYFEIPDAGHNANMDNPEAFNRVLLAFVGDVVAGENGRAPTG